MKKICGMSLLLLFLTACATTEEVPQRPAWIEDPQGGVSASCGTHVRGRHYQEDLAVSRAREQLAARFGVSVEMTQNTREVVVNDRAYVTSVKNSEQKISSGKVVKAIVKEKWYDKRRDEIWVWVVPID